MQFITRAQGRAVAHRGHRGYRVLSRDVDDSKRSNEWYTPPRVFDAMPGVAFDLDVASPGREIVPWIPAREHITSGSLERNGLASYG